MDFLYRLILQAIFRDLESTDLPIFSYSIIRSPPRVVFFVIFFFNLYEVGISF